MLFRKIATILLLSFLFFNWVGYWLFISICESHEETLWEARLDSDQYDSAQTFLIKVPASRLPYSNASTRYERADGKVDIGSLHYRYVGKRLYNDSVEFLCLPDKEANRLQAAKNDYFGLVNDLQNTGHNKTPASSGKAAGDILKVCYLDHYQPALTYFPTGTPRPVKQLASALSSGYIRIGKQPPRDGWIL